MMLKNLKNFEKVKAALKKEEQYEKIYWGTTLPNLSHKRVVFLDVSTLISGSQNQGDVEAKLLGVLNDADRKKQIVDLLHQTNLFDARNEKLSWSVRTRTTDPTSLEAGVRSVVSKVIQQAENDNVF